MRDGVSLMMWDEGTGNTIAITDETQVIINSYSYTPFGVISSEQEAFPQPFKFVGQYGVMVESNGLYYMRARYYDPSVGRFISEDPIGFESGEINFYVYAANNPILFVDQGGEDWVSTGFGIVGYIVSTYGLFTHNIATRLIGVAISTGAGVYAWNQFKKGENGRTETAITISLAVASIAGEASGNMYYGIVMRALGSAETLADLAQTIADGIKP